jgi:TatD DNase family protein
MLVDSHAHLDDEAFAADLPEVVARAQDAGVGRILSVGCDLQSSRAAIALADRFPAVWASVGVHPNSAGGWDGSQLGELESLLRHPKAVAVGEMGLDFHREHAPRDRQAAAFADQLELAVSLDLPIILHARESNRQVIDTLASRRRAWRGVMHCYSGGVPEARECLALGLHLSFGGPITYPNASRLREVVGELPIESFLLETDAPYLPPQSKRGQRNEPACIPAIAEAAAALKTLSPVDVARITTLAARTLFGLDLPGDRGALAYRIRDSLYLNVTNRCTNRCVFCRRLEHPVVKGHRLDLDHEPTVREMLAEIEGQAGYREVVFCGYGEPLLRPDFVREVATILKARGATIRVNTNGLADRHLGRHLAAELAGLVDEYSVSLNAPDDRAYDAICRPQTGPGSHQAVIDFAREALSSGAAVTLTAVDLPGLDIAAVGHLASSIGARFRIRRLDQVG